MNTKEQFKEELLKLLEEFNLSDDINENLLDKIIDSFAQMAGEKSKYGTVEICYRDDLLCLQDIPEKNKIDFNYMDDSDQFEFTILPYNGYYFDTADMEYNLRLDIISQGDSYFSSTLTKLVTTDYGEELFITVWVAQ